MSSRNIDWEGYRGLARLFVLAFVLAIVLWWAVAVRGPRRPASKPVPPTPPTPTPARRTRHQFGNREVSTNETIVLEKAPGLPTPTEDSDDYWPDIIDA